MAKISLLPKSLRNFLLETGELTEFSLRFFTEVFGRPWEFNEFLKQCYRIGVMSLPLVALTGFIMGVVFTLQTRPTLIEFGAEAWIPSMVAISIVREIGPVITALIIAGKVGSSIGAELGSMKVTEQIDAMEVSGTNPYRYLVVTRVLGGTLMVPMLVILSDFVGMLGSFLMLKLKGGISLALYFNQVFEYLYFSDITPAIIKTFFFGFAICMVGCFKGYSSDRGTEGVGIAANSAVVMASVVVFIIDFMAVLVADIFFEL